MRDPTTPEEWQQAVDLAEALLALQAAQAYGLVRGGPVVDVDRCEEVRAAGKAQGYEPTPAGVDACIVALSRGE